MRRVRNPSESRSTRATQTSAQWASLSPPLLFFDKSAVRLVGSGARTPEVTPRTGPGETQDTAVSIRANAMSRELIVARISLDEVATVPNGRARLGLS
jgi:hypothetical protein